MLMVCCTCWTKAERVRWAAQQLQCATRSILRSGERVREDTGVACSPLLHLKTIVLIVFSSKAALLAARIA